MGAVDAWGEGAEDVFFAGASNSASPPSGKLTAEDGDSAVVVVGQLVAGGWELLMVISGVFDGDS